MCCRVYVAVIGCLGRLRTLQLVVDRVPVMIHDCACVFVSFCMSFVSLSAWDFACVCVCVSPFAATVLVECRFGKSVLPRWR